MLAFLVVCCFSCCSCCFCCRFLRFPVVYGVAFVAAVSYSFAAVFAALLLLLLRAFKSPTVEAPIFARF